MAAIQTDKPIIKMTAATDSISGLVAITSIRWVSKTATAGDDLLIVDAEGDTILEAIADGANFEREYLVVGRWDTPEVSVIDSGAIYVNRYVMQIAGSVPTYGAWGYQG